MPNEAKIQETKFDQKNYVEIRSDVSKDLIIQEKFSAKINDTDYGPFDSFAELGHAINNPAKH